MSHCPKSCHGIWQPFLELLMFWSLPSPMIMIRLWYPCHTAPSLQDPNSRPLWTFHLALAPATTNATISASMHTWRAGYNPQSTTFFGLMLKHQHRALETNTTPQTKPWTPAWHESSILSTYCKMVQPSGYAWDPMHWALVRRCKTTGSFRECHPQGLLEAFPWLWLPRCHPWTTDSMPDTTWTPEGQFLQVGNLSQMQMKVRSNKSIHICTVSEWFVLQGMSTSQFGSPQWQSWEPAWLCPSPASASKSGTGPWNSGMSGLWTSWCAKICSCW